MKLSGMLDIFDRWGATAGLVAVAAAYCFFVDLPYGQATAQLRSDSAERRRFIADAERLTAATAALEAEGRAAEDYVRSWRNVTPKSAAVSSYYGEIHNAVRQAGVEVTRFEPQAAVTLATIEQRPIALAMEGTHAQISTALLNLERLPATIWVRDVVVTPTRETAGHVQFESKLVVFADNAAKSD
jgi:Tfp pilus assembly protein PilO